MMEIKGKGADSYENGERYHNGCYVCGSYGICRLCGRNRVDSGAFYVIVILVNRNRKVHGSVESTESWSILRY